ncbi:hypothetical protein D3C72_1670700 [compost metagenome]
MAGHGGEGEGLVALDADQHHVALAGADGGVVGFTQRQLARDGLAQGEEGVGHRGQAPPVHVQRRALGDGAAVGGGEHQQAQATLAFAALAEHGVDAVDVVQLSRRRALAAGTANDLVNGTALHLLPPGTQRKATNPAGLVNQYCVEV